MPIIVSPYLPFPPLIWWASAMEAGAVLLDGEEHFVKTTVRNRYSIATANGLLQLGIPLRGGRGQRSAMKDVMIDNSARWQELHWRGLLSAYGRAPFFEHYAPELEALFYKKPYAQLIHFSRESIRWCCDALRISITLNDAGIFQKKYDGGGYDWRFEHSKSLSNPAPMPRYPQVFESARGFLPNLSLLDLLMNEGPVAVRYIAQLKTTM